MSETKRAIMPTDLNDLVFLGEVQLAPDASYVYYEISYINAAKNIYQGEIYRLSLKDRKMQQLTSGLRRDSVPRLSPDGTKLAFLSDRSEDGKRQVYVQDVTAPGEARAVTGFQPGVIGFVWSGDSRYIAALVETSDDPTKAAASAAPETPEAKQEREAKEKEAARIGGNLTTFSQFKMRADGRRTLFAPDAHVQLWLVDTNAAKPNARQITNGGFNVSHPAFSPDGKSLVFSSPREQEHVDFYSITDLWLIDPFATDFTPRKLTSSAGTATNAAFSPDGCKLAFAGHRNPRDYSFLETVRVWTLDLDAPDAEPRCLTPDFDFTAANLVNTDLRAFSEFVLQWSMDGSEIYFGATVGGSLPLYKVAADGQSQPQPLTPEGFHTFSYSFAPVTGQFVYTAYAPHDTGQIYLASVSAPGEKPVAITELNKDWWADKYLAPVENFKFPSADGQVEIEGWLVKPPDFDPAKRYPMLTMVHGGPHTAYGNSFYIEFQMMAGNGFLVLYTNPRGSIGYGHPFARIHNDWGGKDFEDVMSAVDYAIANYSADPERLGIGGGSYGGYMTNWAVTHTDRFKAALSERCVSNLTTMYTLSDIGGSFIESEFEGDIWTNPRIWERSPVAHANKKIATPLLLLHSEADYRCPIEQAEEMYFALKRFGSDVTLVRTPGEDHNLSRSGSPAHRVERLNRILNWFRERC
jgi:dipeptidyl aminopeptidase/acylaminoacyl peptidase